MLEFLAEPFQFEFFRSGALAATLVGGLCGLIGVYVVLRGMSYIGHGLSHAIFGGAVVSYVMSLNFYAGAGLWGFLAALLINQTARQAEVKEDAAIGVVTTASFAVGVAVISRFRSYTRSFEAALFGNVLGVRPEDVWVVAGVTALVGLCIFAFYRQLLFLTFDRESAQVYGISVAWLDTLFALVLAAAIIASIQVLGVTLIAAALVVPAISARLLTDSFSRTVLLSSVIGAGTALTGLYFSFFLDVASGAAIVLTQSGLFVLLLMFSRGRKAISRGSAASPG